MAPHLTCQSVRVAVSKTAEDGFLVFVDGCLVAVITHLNTSVGDDFPKRWFLEAGFGPCADHMPPIFDSPDHARQWVLERYAEAFQTEVSVAPA